MQALAQNVTVIPARRRVGSQRTAAQVQKTRVAVYCRVSTDSEEQETSYEAQVSHYTEFIQSKPEWQMVEVYADATDIIGLKQNPTNGRRFSPIFLCIGHFSE